jgi:sRNA-binding carbon storage regulator CsrA
MIHVVELARNETVRVGNVTVKLVEVYEMMPWQNEPRKVRLGFEAPRDVVIVRSELLNRMEETK